VVEFIIKPKYSISLAGLKQDQGESNPGESNNEIIFWTFSKGII